MANTFKKSLKTVVFTLMDGSTTVTATDTDSAAVGSMALAQFDAKSTVVVVGDSGITKIPFHAIMKVEISVSEGEEQSRDPYGCDEEGETGETETGETETGETP